jgi:nitrate reductase gamma subunit
MGVIQLLVYACVLIFVVAVVAKIWRYASAPVHMRWELYPVAHEKGRHQYGGSFFEELNWWEKKREIDHVNEAREMAQEIVLLKGVRLNNQRLWVWSFPFHLGLYLVTGWFGLLVLGAILQVVGVEQTGALFTVVGVVTLVAGYGGMVLTAVGALGLFLYRLGNRDMRRFNTPVDYLHLVWFAAGAIFGLAAYGLQDPEFAGLRGFVADLVTLRPAPPLATGPAVAVAAGMLLVAYIPFTRMVHFAAKYFLYHDVRWSDEPLSKGGAIESRVRAALDYGVGWRAPHIQTGKSWAEVATEEKE